MKLVKNSYSLKHLWTAASGFSFLILKNLVACLSQQVPVVQIYIRGCLCDIWKPSFLPLLIFDWCTFSRRVTARWWRQWVKNQVLTNQNSRNRWCLIVRRIIWEAHLCQSWLYSKIFYHMMMIDQVSASVSLICNEKSTSSQSNQNQ